jgi:outer membrane lipoprotein-sorting protein
MYVLTKQLFTPEMNRATPFVLLLLALVVGITAAAQDAKEIIVTSNNKLRGNTSYSEMSLKIVRPSWTREMKMKNWAKGDSYAMVVITYPAKEKGIVFLKRDKEIWNWIPSIERNIKLPPSMMMQSWMGTDFTNDDLVKESSVIDDYTHKLLVDSTIEGRICWKIELIPLPDAAVVWGKLLIWIDQKDYMQLRTEFYDEDGYLVNIMRGTNVKMLGGKLLPSRMEMIPVEEEGKMTIMEYHTIEFDTPIEDNFFTTQKMKRIR